MLLDNYDSLRQNALQIWSISSEMPAQQIAEQLPKKLPNPISRNEKDLSCRDPGCGSKDVIEDANSGSVVCIQCGMIQCTSVFENASTDAQYHEGVSRIAVRRYSRIIYLSAVLRSMCGETQIVLLPGWKLALESYFQNGEHPRTGPGVKKAIQFLRLPKKLLFHSQTIAFMLFGAKCPNPSEEEKRTLLRRFHALESAWDRQPLGGSVRKGRKKFLSMAVVWENLCQQLKLPELSNLIPPPKNAKLRERQLRILCKLEDLI